MTWSLKISNGDLAKGYDNNLEVVRGSEKVVQDLICWIREPIGTDPVNPDVGSFIQNGIEGETYLVNNNMVVMPNDYSQMVISEISRLIQYYQVVQNTKLEQEIAQFGRVVTFDEDEIIYKFDINYIENFDTLYVAVNLQTITGDVYVLNIPIKSNSIVKGI